MPSIRLVFRVLFAFYLLMGVVDPGWASEPQVSFAVKQGWLDFLVEQDGAPLSDVRVQSYDSQGNRFAEGETGAKGRGNFPLPAGNRFLVELKIGERHADPIWLTRVGDNVVPNEVLLSFGLRPCCRASALRPSEATLPSESLSPWFPLVSLAVLLLVGIKLGLAIFIAKHPAARLAQSGDSNATIH